jgi:hypothetical protein
MTMSSFLAPDFTAFRSALSKFSSLEERITDGSSSRAGATPRVTVGTKRVCGGSRAAQTGVAPALFMTPRAVLSRPRLLSESVFLHLFTNDNRRTVHRAASRTKPAMGMVRLSGAGFSCWHHSPKVSEEPMIRSQQIGSERDRLSCRDAHCVENNRLAAAAHGVLSFVLRPS